jgi:predicted DNA-binding protein
MKANRSKKPPRVTEHTSLRLEPELLERLEAAAARERRPLAHMMRIALTDWLADRSDQAARAARA